MFNYVMENGAIIFTIAAILIMFLMLFAVPVLDFFKRRSLDKKFRETAEQNHIGWKKKREEIEAKRKRETETLLIFETKYPAFFNSPHKKFIEKFAKKFNNKINDIELSKLQLVLKNHQWDFSLYELKLLLDREIKRQTVEEVKAKFLNNEKGKYEEILKQYLASYSIFDEPMLEILAEILKEKELFFQDTEGLKKDLIMVKEKIEAEEFARFLLSDSPSSSIHTSARDSQHELLAADQSNFQLQGFESECAHLPENDALINSFESPAPPKRSGNYH